MPWLWYAALPLIAVIYWLTTRRTSVDARRRAELEGVLLQLTDLGVLAAPQVDDAPPEAGDGPYRSTPASDKRLKRVRALPDDLGALLAAQAPGSARFHYVLRPKAGYLSFIESNAISSTDFLAVTMRLAEAAPALSVRPVVVLDGEPMRNVGLLFSKDPDFMRAFIVEGTDGKAVGRWVNRQVRAALRRLPRVWMHTSGSGLTVGLYGRPDADDLRGLLDISDALFREYGINKPAGLLHSSTLPVTDAGVAATAKAQEA